MREWFVRFVDWFRRGSLERELAEELRFHQRQLERDASAGGADATQAAAVAKRRLGNSTRVAEEARERWSIPALDTILQDTRYALRGLRRSPGFTATVVVTLSLGIGANAAMFNVVDRLMFRPLGLLRDPGTVHRVYFESVRDGRPQNSTWIPFARYQDLLRWTSSFSQIAGFNERSVALGVGDAARERRIGAVTASFFGMFDAPPVLGRYFTADEDIMPRGAEVIVLTHAYWQAEFGGRDVLGQRMQVGNVLATIIGVAPRGLVGVADRETPVAFVPIAAMPVIAGGQVPPEMFVGYNLFWGHVLARRKPGVSVEAASADISRAYQQSWDAERAASGSRFPPPPREVAQPRAVVSAVRTGAGPDPSLESRTAMWIGGVAAIVLLIACANVANLHLSRMLRRQRETAVRLSLGAGRSRLLGQALTESVVLAVFAAAGGLFVAHFGGAVIRRLLMPDSDAAVGTLTDARTLIVTAVIALAVGILTGLAPALLAGRANLSSSLRNGARGATTHRGRLRTTLLVVQGALSVALLVGATLFVRSLDAVQAMRMGYDADRTLIVRRMLRGVQLDAEARATLRRSLVERAQSLPSVEAASWANATPLSMTGMRRFSVPGVDSVGRLGQFTVQETSADYFRAIGTRIVRGRGFSAEDRRGAPNVVVVSESMARVVWPGRDAIGQCMRFDADTMPCTTVVGVAEDMVQSEITATRLQYYLPLEQGGGPDAGTLVLRVRGDPALEADNVRRALQQVMPATSYVIVQPMEELVERTRRPWRLGATMFVAFGGLALIVAAVGLYGVIGYDVTQRMHELGVRVALGARRTDVLRLVIGQSVRLTVVGVVIGSLIALAAARWLQPLLYQQSARDPVVYAIVAALLLIVAFAASASPAARAANADPNVVLRTD